MWVSCSDIDAFFLQRIWRNLTVATNVQDKKVLNDEKQTIRQESDTLCDEAAI